MISVYLLLDYFSRLACACIHVHARDEVLADNNNSL